jgi:hypothetical protein
LHDLTAAVESLPAMLTPDTQSEGMRATRTDGAAGRGPGIENGEKNLGPNLGPYPAIFGRFRETK